MLAGGLAVLVVVAVILYARSNSVRDWIADRNSDGTCRVCGQRFVEGDQIGTYRRDDGVLVAGHTYHGERPFG
jgi:hypothetical protein